jgi:hypothetical protein
MDWVDVAMEEHKTLREESLGAIEQAQRSLQLGLAAIAAITAFAATQGTSVGTLDDVAISLAGPLVAALVGILWVLEVFRAVRAGAHIAALEQRINRRFPAGDDALRWETSVLDAFSKPGNKTWVYNWAVRLTLFATTIPSVAIGFDRLRHRAHHGSWLLAVIVIDVVLVLLSLGLQQWFDHAAKQHRLDAIREVTAGRGAAAPA